MKTEDLGSALTHAHDFEHVCEAFADSFLTRPFVTYLYALMDKYGLQKSDLITRANLKRATPIRFFGANASPRGISCSKSPLDWAAIWPKRNGCSSSANAARSTRASSGTPRCGSACKTATRWTIASFFCNNMGSPC